MLALSSSDAACVRAPQRRSEQAPALTPERRREPPAELRPGEVSFASGAARPRRHPHGALSGRRCPGRRQAGPFRGCARPARTGASVEDAAGRPRARPERPLRRAELPLAASSSSPNDPMFDRLWGLQPTLGDQDIDAPEAWNLTTGQLERRRGRHRHRRRLRPPGSERQHLEQRRRDRREWRLTTTTTATSTTSAAGTSSERRRGPTRLQRPRHARRRDDRRRGQQLGGRHRRQLGRLDHAASCRRHASVACPDRHRRTRSTTRATTAPTSSTAASARRAESTRFVTRSSPTACQNTLFVFAAGNEGRSLQGNTSGDQRLPVRVSTGLRSAQPTCCLRRGLGPTDGIASFSNRGSPRFTSLAPGVDIRSSLARVLARERLSGGLRELVVVRRPVGTHGRRLAVLATARPSGGDSGRVEPHRLARAGSTIRDSRVQVDPPRPLPPVRPRRLRGFEYDL